MILTQVGENSVAFSVAMERTSDCVLRIRALERLIQQEQFPDLVSVQPGLDTLVIRFREITDSIIQELEALNQELGDPAPLDYALMPLVQIPVCYEEELALDLAMVSETTGLSYETIATAHSSVIYDVWMLGFMPGFPYLGELSQRLQIPRKPTPVPNIPAGSVAIAEEYSGIYPLNSPGGWHVIGRTPISILDYSRVQPWLLDYGSRVQFFPISLNEFHVRSGKK